MKFVPSGKVPLPTVVFSMTILIKRMLGLKLTHPMSNIALRVVTVAAFMLTLVLSAATYLRPGTLTLKAPQINVGI